LGPWLSSFIEVFYDRYVHIHEAFAQYPELKTYLLDESAHLTPWDFLNFVDLQGDDIYNLQLYSQIIRWAGHEFPRRRPAPVPLVKTPPRTGKKPLGRLKEILRKLEDFLMGLGFFRNDVVFLEGNLERWWKFRLCFTPGFRARFIHWGYPPEVQTDCHQPARRELAGVVVSRDPFVNLLVKALPRNFPTLYLEGYHPCRQWVLQRFGAKDFPKVLIGLGQLWSDDYGKLLAGEIVARGGRIIDFQHGAGYGFSRLLEVERYSRKVNDRFYSWGWAGQNNDPKLAVLPGAKVSLRKRPAGTSSGLRQILVVGTVFPRYLYRFQSMPVGTQFARYIQMTKDFLGAVDQRWQKHLVFRGHSLDYGWGIAEQIKRCLPHVAIDHHHHGFRHQLRQSRLMVFDHPGTTFLEAMAADVPAIIFFDLEYWQVRSEARSFLDLLQAAGIFHHTPQSAARQVNRVYEEIDAWWLDHPVQEARKRFTDHFARGSPDWSRQWAETINRELQEVWNKSAPIGEGN
jgi:putative transferase (TIGR04331 family)